MTTPFLMNCAHLDNGWCLDCVAQAGERIADLDKEIRELKREVVRSEMRIESLKAAGQAVVDRWNTPLWKDVAHTGVTISKLQAALSGKE